MELELSAEQDLFVSTSQRFITDHNPISRVRAVSDGEPADLKLQRRSAELGWFAMFVPEELGGGSVSGQPVADAALVAELRGATLQSEPFIAAHGAAVLLSRCAPEALRSRLLPELAGAESMTVVALAGDANRGVGVIARGDGAGWVLTGYRVVVAGAEGVDHVLVVAQDADGPGRVGLIVDLGAPRVSRERAQSLDVTQPLELVDFDGVTVAAESGFAIPDADLAVANATTAVLSVAESVGAMTSLFELTRQYALDRTAFGRPIGSFQALKHLLADLSLTVEEATAVSAAATRALREEQPYAAEVAAIAKAFVGDRAAAFGQGCLQVFGGIGFAWEHDLHLYLRRLTANAQFFGTTDQHRDAVLAAHAAELEDA